jgi:hypothetical protein
MGKARFKTGGGEMNRSSPLRFAYIPHGEVDGEGLDFKADRERKPLSGCEKNAPTKLRWQPIAFPSSRLIMLRAMSGNPFRADSIPGTFHSKAPEMGTAAGRLQNDLPQRLTG